MNAFILLALQSSEGQVAQIARTFGVDWVHLGAQIVSFSIVCAVAIQVCLPAGAEMLEERRRQIAQGLENAEKIKAELDRTEAQRQEVIAQAHTQAAQFIEEARAAAARVLQQETQKAIHRQPSKSRPKLAKPPPRTMSACSANSNVRSVGWLCRRPQS